MQKPLRSKTQLSPVAGVRMAAVFLCAGAVLFDAGPAFSELNHTTSYRRNPVHGTTPEQLWGYMAGHPIIDEDGPALANITHDHTLSVQTARAAGVCRVARVDFTWHFVITVPTAVDEARMSPATRAMWREFTAYLRRHEEHHRAIFIGCGRDFLAKAAKLTAPGPCVGLKGRVKRYIDEQYQVCMAEQRAYDRDERQTVANLALRRAHRK
jgi:predicted secreted Zn-dependent protease